MNCFKTGKGGWAALFCEKDLTYRTYLLNSASSFDTKVNGN